MKLFRTNPFLEPGRPRASWRALRSSGQGGRAAAAALVLTLAALITASARPWRPSQIPNGTVFSCANCHLSAAGGGPRNAFGSDVAQFVAPASSAEFWQPALAELDSDGDGFSNGTELGDPDGDSNPESSTGITNPGDASSAPAAEEPVVTITAPGNEAILAPGEVEITADASVEGGTIASVEFFNGDESLGMDDSEPFSITVNLQTGTHTLTAIATTDTGATVTSSSIEVTVSSGSVPIENPFEQVIAQGDFTIELEPVLEGLVSPLGMAVPDDGSGRFFVFDQTGVIHVVQDRVQLETPLLDISSRLVSLRPGYDERGLLGVATHPNFAENPLIYTYSSEPNGPMADFPITPAPGETINHQSVLAEWRMDPDNPNQIDPESRREILRIDQPQSNHNGGAMHFGPDGYLYLGLGDGGAADDQGSGHSPGGNAQDISNILGDFIRIDVDARTSANGQYGVPADNPFVGTEGVDEIYAVGFRNPYSWSFDQMTGELYVADVGQNQIEELNRVFLGGNYGWPVKEGTFYFDMNGENDGFVTAEPVVEVPPNLADPIAQYDHDDGLAIVGGYVYYGRALPNLTGTYITGDLGTFSDPEGRLYYLDRGEFKEFRIGVEGRPLGLWLKGFGQDPEGEVYVFASGNIGPSGNTGQMLKIVPVDTGIMITSLAVEEGNLTITWEGGVGPFALQWKSDLNNDVWMTAAATHEHSATVPIEHDMAFFRVTEMAGNPAIGFTVHMTGAAERPDMVETPGTGTGTLSLVGNTLHFNIQYSGLTGPATAAHIHGRASAAESAGVMIGLAPYNGGAFGASGMLSGSVVLTAEQKAAVLAGETYVNIHTEAHGSGEIRGQIAPILFTAELTGGAERPDSVETEGEGLGVFLLVGNQLSFDISYEGLSSEASNAHIHGPASLSEGAGVLVGLGDFNGGSWGTTGTLNGTVTLDPQNLAYLLDGRTYVNIHSAMHGSGEIRGQILPKTTAVALSASLTGAAERPDPVETPGTGGGIFALEGDLLHFSIHYTGLKEPATAAHIHGPASAAESTGVMISLEPYHNGEFGTSGTFSGTIQLTPEHRAWILQGRTYVNIHTSAHGGGEIRGQIAPAVMHAELLGTSEHPAVETAGHGQATLILAGNQLTIGASYSDLSSTASNAHIHGPAEPSESAGVMVGIADLHLGDFGTQGSFAGTVMLDPDQLAELIDERTYINIHSENHGSGEIRGQILR